MADTLNPGQTLTIGQQLQSRAASISWSCRPTATWCNTKEAASLGPSGTPDTWSLPAAARPTRAIMQQDGNFVLYNATGNPAWATDTNGNPGARLVLQDDRNLVVYASSNRALWAHNTLARPAHRSRPPPSRRSRQNPWVTRSAWTRPPPCTGTVSSSSTPLAERQLDRGTARATCWSWSSTPRPGDLRFQRLGSARRGARSGTQLRKFRTPDVHGEIPRRHRPVRREAGHLPGRRALARRRASAVDRGHQGRNGCRPGGQGRDRSTRVGDLGALNSMQDP